MNADEREQHADEVRDKIKKYEHVLKSIVALEHKFGNLGGMSVHQGKKLRIANSVSGGDAGKKVTPDMVVEAAGPGRPYRAVVEIKGSLPKRPENWGDVIDQLEKYRLATEGWDGTAPVAPHDVMLATGTPHAEKFAGEMAQSPAGSGMEKWLVVIRVAAAKHGGEECIEIAKVYGQISHSKIDAKMSPEAHCRIPLYEIMEKIDQMKFYDSYPPVEYTMTILWDHVFSKFVRKKNLRPLRDGQDVAIYASMEQIRDGIRSFSPQTNRDCVCESWISDAMLEFKKMNVVSDREDGSFTIIYKKRGKHTTKWIMAKTASREKSTAGARATTNSSESARLDKYFKEGLG